MRARSKRTQKVEVEGSVPVIFLKEGRKFVAYTPVLELATCADTLDDAKKRFGEALEIFFEELVNMGTLEEVLAECGWRKISRPRARWVPPEVEVVAEESFPVPVPV